PRLAQLTHARRNFPTPASPPASSAGHFVSEAGHCVLYPPLNRVVYSLATRKRNKDQDAADIGGKAPTGQARQEQDSCPHPIRRPPLTLSAISLQKIGDVTKMMA